MYSWNEGHPWSSEWFHWGQPYMGPMRTGSSSCRLQRPWSRQISWETIFCICHHCVAAADKKSGESSDPRVRHRMLVGRAKMRTIKVISSLWWDFYEITRSLVRFWWDHGRWRPLWIANYKTFPRWLGSLFLASSSHGVPTRGFHSCKKMFEK